MSLFRLVSNGRTVVNLYSIVYTQCNQIKLKKDGHLNPDKTEVGLIMRKHELNVKTV